MVQIRCRPGALFLLNIAIMWTRLVITFVHEQTSYRLIFFSRKSFPDYSRMWCLPTKFVLIAYTLYCLPRCVLLIFLYISACSQYILSIHFNRKHVYLLFMKLANQTTVDTCAMKLKTWRMEKDKVIWDSCSWLIGVGYDVVCQSPIMFVQRSAVSGIQTSLSATNNNAVVSHRANNFCMFNVNIT